MATIWEKNQKLRFSSKYTNPGKQITATQYLAEFICERLAQHKRTTLTIRFWNKSEWAEIYQHQIVQATKLLKEFALTDIIAVLRKLSSIYSLGNRKLILQNIKKEIKSEVEDVPIATKIEPPRSEFGKIDKLKGL